MSRHHDASPDGTASITSSGKSPVGVLLEAHRSTQNNSGFPGDTSN